MNEETKKHLQSGADIIVSVSGGKDSTACCLNLFERVTFDVYSWIQDGKMRAHTSISTI
jgi:tRNA(Ile)-lysidine synthase TilS/MesJ